MSRQADDRLLQLVAQEQVRVAALGSRQRGADELAEQRGRAVGAALELGMGLRADPEGMVDELDELDQPAVGRRCPSTRRPAASNLARYLVLNS